MPKKRKGLKLGAKAGMKVAPRAGRLGGKTGKLAGKAAWKAARGEAKLARAAMSSREPAASRYLKYALFALAGLTLGAILARSKSENGTSSSFTGTTGHHTPDPSSPAGRRGETWGSGTPTGTAGGGAAQQPGGTPSTGADRDVSDPASGPLIGDQHRGPVAGVPPEQTEVAQRIRTRIGEDPRTADMPRVNVEVIDGVAELRGPAPSEEAKLAAGEIASSTEGVNDVRNLIVVG